MMDLTYAERLILEAAIKVCDDITKRGYELGDDQLVNIQAAFAVATCALMEAVEEVDQPEEVAEEHYDDY
jgi:hypothetical protein